ncbi:MAG TPA: TetR/AcrR family transcriptional regulator [Anaeromyxobacteraceae bacterium]|nr:TetR/AcrR family transcriptional regulator [Anaeromyxobacteraceae bacterium]
MPRQRFLNMPEAARSRLLGIALEEFARQGFEQASLNRILAAAGISKGACYYYFDDKEDLFATAIEGALDAALSRLRLPDFEGLTPDDFWPAVERCVGEWAETFESSGDLVKVTLLVDEARRRSPRFAGIVAKGHAFWRVLLEAGQRLGCVRTDIPNDLLLRLVEANDAALDGIFLAVHPEVTRAALESHIRLVFDTFRRLLAVAPGPRRPGRRPPGGRRSHERVR